jgi:DNA polymerase V
MSRVLEVGRADEAAVRAELPLLACRVAAGFPSPADDHLERRIDLNAHLVRRPGSTFFLRVEGDSMSGAGILDGDLIAVDRSAKAADGSVVVVALGGELTVKRLARGSEGWELRAENPRYAALPVPEEGFAVWGVVVAVVRRMR